MKKDHPSKSSPNAYRDFMGIYEVEASIVWGAGCTFGLIICSP